MRPGGERSPSDSQCQHDESHITSVGFAAQKKSEHDSQRDTPRVQALRQTFTATQMQDWQAHPEKLKFLDETGIHLGMTPRYGRAAPGQRVVEATPGHSGKQYTLTAVLSLKGLEAPWVLEGPMTADTFETYVEQYLCPTLQPGDMVVADNLSAHKAVKIRAVIEARGARLEFLPPYSADFNPIEPAWAKAKGILRRAKARALDPLIDAIVRAVQAITGSNSRAWFEHCGYI
jgi:transposase